MEFEKALLVGEYQSNLKELKNDHILRDKLVEKLNEIEKRAEQRQKLQLQHQEKYKQTIDRIEIGIKRYTILNYFTKSELFFLYERISYFLKALQNLRGDKCVLSF